MACPLVKLAKPSSKEPFKVRKVHIFWEGHKNMCNLICQKRKRNPPKKVTKIDKETFIDLYLFILLLFESLFSLYCAKNITLHLLMFGSCHLDRMSNDELTGRFRQIFWPSQNIWALERRENNSARFKAKGFSWRQFFRFSR